MQIYSFHIKALKTVHTQVSPSHTSYGGGLLNSAVDQAMPKSSRVVQSRYVRTYIHSRVLCIQRFVTHVSIEIPYSIHTPKILLLAPSFLFISSLCFCFRGCALYMYILAPHCKLPSPTAVPRIAGFPRRAPRHTAVKYAAPRLHCPCDTTTSKAFSDPTNRNAIHIR